MPSLLELLTAKAEPVTNPKTTLYDLLNEPSDDENDYQQYLEDVSPQMLVESGPNFKQTTAVKKANGQSMWERNQEFLQRKKEKLKQIEQQNKASFKPTINKKSKILDRKRQIQMRTKLSIKTNLPSKEPLLQLPLSSKEVKVYPTQNSKKDQPMSQCKPVLAKSQQIIEKDAVKSIDHKFFFAENFPQSEEKCIEQSNRPSFLEFPTDNDYEEADEQPKSFELLFDANCSFSGKK